MAASVVSPAAPVRAAARDCASIGALLITISDGPFATAVDIVDWIIFGVVLGHRTFCTSEQVERGCRQEVGGWRLEVPHREGHAQEPNASI